jgi:hypothetical protein
MIEKSTRFIERIERDILFDDNVIIGEGMSDYYSRTDITKERSEIKVLCTPEMALGTSLNNYAPNYAIKENASTITLHSGLNNEREVFKFYIDVEEYFFNDSKSTLQLRFSSHLLEQYCTISLSNSYNLYFNGTEISIDLIDVNRVFPPIGPPVY